MAPRAFDELPRAVQQGHEEFIVPLIRLGGPRAFHSAGEGVGPFAVAALAGPRVVDVLPRRRARAQGACAVALAEGVSATDQGHRLRVVHAHAPEGIADVVRALGGVGIHLVTAIRLLGHRAFRVQIDQANSGAAQRTGAGAVDGAGSVLLLLRARSQI
eukprot:Skav234096  [mRNA]  locus=scaffold4778:57224:65738:+ [translate_table: standard]